MKSGSISLAIPVDRAFLLASLNCFKIRDGSSDAMFTAEHLFDRSITLGSLAAVVPNLQTIGALHTDPLGFTGGITVVVEFHIRSHLLTLFAEVALLLVNHGFRDFFLFNFFSLIRGLWVGSRFKACLQ